MRVALLIESLDGGGSERAAQRLAVGLAQRGNPVFVYCLDRAATRVDRLQAAGVHVREAHSRGRDVRLAWRLARWLHRDRIDVIHAHSCAALVHAFPAAAMLGIPLIHVWHGRSQGRWSWHRRCAIYLDRFAACVGINSQSLRAALPRPTSAQAVYLPNGIDLPVVTPLEARRRMESLCGQPLRGPIVLHVANVRPEKDICVLLAAFARLRCQWPEAHLVSVGAVRDSEYARQVRNTAESLALNESVHWLGPVSDAWRLMAGADVFCLASCMESMPNVILEAMSQRVPIVATAVGDIGRLPDSDLAEAYLLRHEQTGLLVPPGDSSALAAALDRTLRDRPAAQQRGDRAFAEERRRFTTAHMVARYLQVYRAVRGGRSGRNAPAPRRRVVLMLGPAPPQIGGMVTSINLLMKSPLRARYTLHRCATPVPAGAPGGAARHRRVRRWSGLLLAVVRHSVALLRLADLLMRQRVDLVHIHTCSYWTFYRNLLDLAVAKLLRRAVILHIRGGKFARFCRRASRPGRWLIRRGLAAADAIVVLSERWRRVLEGLAGTTPITVVPNAVETVRRSRAPESNGRPCRFLYLANLTAAKGLGDLLAAAGRLASGNVPFELIVAGPARDAEQPVWERRANQAGIAGRTSFYGPVSAEQKAHLLASADCFVHPSHSEALPNAVLEAAAAGLPVIATAVGSLPEVLRRAGDACPLCPLVSPRAPEELAAAMSRLARDTALRRRIGSALRQHVHTHFSLEHVAERLAEVYEHALHRTRDRGGKPA